MHIRSDNPRRPLVGMVLAFVAGMLLSAVFMPDGRLLFALFFIHLIALLAWRPVDRQFPYFLLIALAGATHLLVALPGYSKHDVLQLKNKLPIKQAHINGVVKEQPEFRAYRNQARGRWVFALEGKAMGRDSERRPLRGRIDISVHGWEGEPPFQSGNRVVCSGTLQSRYFPGGEAIELYVPSMRMIQAVDRGWASSYHAALGRLRAWAAGQLDNGDESHAVHANVLNAIVLGFREHVDRELLDTFRRTGAMHIFAISGLHVGMVALLVCMVLKSCGVSIDRYCFYLLPLLFFFVTATGMRSSAMRAFTMAAAYFIAPAVHRRPDLPSSIALSALLLLLFRPLDIVDIGFIYTFVIVIFIVMGYRVVPKQWMRGNRVKVYALGLLVTSLAANAASIPLSAYFFGIFSPVSLLANLLVVPLAFLAVLSGWLSILCLPFSTIFNHTAYFFIDGLIRGVGWLDRLPGSSCHVVPPSLPAVTLWFTSLIYLLIMASKRREIAAGGLLAVSAWILAARG